MLWLTQITNAFLCSEYAKRVSSLRAAKDKAVKENKKLKEQVESVKASEEEYTAIIKVLNSGQIGVMAQKMDTLTKDIVRMKLKNVKARFRRCGALIIHFYSAAKSMAILKLLYILT